MLIVYDRGWVTSHDMSMFRSYKHIIVKRQIWTPKQGFRRIIKRLSTFYKELNNCVENYSKSCNARGRESRYFYLNESANFKLDPSG